ncbi:30S ribosomal protein S4e [Halobacteriales archaeon QS_8_69_26]|nr:MAG: 30S ribosomal protein S4e [Halobacteriales archaeon QS_8_69_26]
MSNHQKRLSVPRAWPVERKTEKYTVKADAGPHGEDGVPLVIVLRDVLGYVDSLKEARYAIDGGSVAVNGDVADDPRRPIGMFDILAFTERGEYYRVFPGEGGRLALTPIDESSAGSKLGKVIGKRQVSGGRTQLNLHDGGNILVEDDADYGVGDSVVVDNEDGSVVAHFPYEEGCLVTAVRGSHAGEVGEMVRRDVTSGSDPNSVVFESGDERLETVEEYVVVIDEQFAGDDADADEESDDEDETDDAAAEEEADEDETDDAAAEEEADGTAEESEESDADAAESEESEESDADAAESEESEESDAAESEESAGDSDEAEESDADDEEVNDDE